MAHTKTEGAPLMFVMGLAIGTMVTALLTPRNGEEVRQTIKQRAEDVKGRLRNTAEDAQGAVEDKLDKAKKIANDTEEKAKKNDMRAG